MRSSITQTTILVAESLAAQIGRASILIDAMYVPVSYRMNGSAAVRVSDSLAPVADNGGACNGVDLAKRVARMLIRNG